MNSILSLLVDFFSMFRLADIIDILIITLVFYRLRGIIHEARVWQILKGIILFIVATWISGVFQLNAINFILRNTMQVGILALIILFQPELRRVLERLGRTNFSSFFREEEVDYVKTASEITKAACALSRARLGALIVIEGKSSLDDVFGTGTELNANVSSDLLITIFFNKTPLHDGAVVIRDDKILHAACVLPLTANEELSHELGTRHRAAIGLSEVSDASIIVVSEETGKISIARNGLLQRDYTEPSLMEEVGRILRSVHPSEETGKKIHRWRRVFSVKNK